MTLPTVLQTSRRITANVLSGAGSIYMAILLVALTIGAIGGIRSIPLQTYIGTGVAIGVLLLAGVVAKTLKLVAITSLYWLAFGSLVQPYSDALSSAFAHDRWPLVVLLIAAAGFAATRSVRFKAEAEDASR
jgi:hypothetical protein